MTWREGGDRDREKEEDREEDERRGGRLERRVEEQ